MMNAKSRMILTVLLAVGCAAAPAPGRPMAAPQPQSLKAVTEAPAPTPNDTLAEAEQAYTQQLGATRGGRFDTERQIMMLKEAVSLYTQFIERAVGHPEMDAAVRKSRERIADARDTLVFLEASLKAQASQEPPLAPTR